MANFRKSRIISQIPFTTQVANGTTMLAQQNRNFILGGDPSFNVKTICAAFGFVCVALAYVSIAYSQTPSNTDSKPESQVIGFTEAYRTIDLSSDELGSIAEMFVKEGDFVEANAPVAQLDRRVQKLQLEIATQVASTSSELTGAERILQKRKSILDRLRILKTKGHASDSEVIRAEMELAIAEAKHMSAKEDKVVREIEMRRAAVQLERRSILAPFAGRVSKIHRHTGEFLSPISPEVVTIIQTDRLLATFNVPSSKVSMLKVGATHQIQLANGSTVDAVVEQVGVITDAQSGTVEVKLVIDNSDERIRSGESVTLSI